MKERIMILPRNGRIVIIDDKTDEEAMPLLKALYKNGFSAMYFSGNQSELPTSPFDDVRVIFLDMELVQGSDENKAATTAKVLSSIVDTSISNVYLLIIWAIHDELLDLFWRYIRENATIKCDFITVMLDKKECRANGFAIPTIESEIRDKLRDKNSYRFIIDWENIIFRSAYDVINDILSLIDVPSDTEEQPLGILKQLAIAFAGKTISQDDNAQIEKNAMLALNGTFTDSLENNIVRLENTGISFEGITVVPEVGVISKINSKLLLDQNNTTAKPGCIYGHTENDDIQEYFKINHGNNPSEIEKVFCEVSPTCDYAQRKWKCHRILYGLKVQAGAAKLEKADYLYKTDIFDIDGQAVKFIFDLRKLKSKNLGELDLLKPLCTFRHDLLVVIQHKIASHCSRPGMLSL
jgi:hypothetical protein